MKTSYNKAGGKRVFDLGHRTYYHGKASGKDYYVAYTWDSRGFAVSKQYFTRSQFTDRIKTLFSRKRIPFKVWGN